MNRELLTIDHLNEGRLVAQINEAIQAASRAIDESDNPKAIAKIAVEIKIAPEGDNFRKVTSAVKISAPAPAAKAEILAVNAIDGVRGIVASDVIEDQLSLPGVANIAARRAANS